VEGEKPSKEGDLVAAYKYFIDTSKREVSVK
jgi:hypothetical protein